MPSFLRSSTRLYTLCPKVFALLAALAVGACTRTPAFVRYGDPAPQPTVIAGAMLFSATSEAVTGPVDVWLRAGIIERIAAAGSITPPADAVVVDGTGATLLPGLIDAHVHAEGSAHPLWDMGLPNPEANMQRYLFAGITTVFDLGVHLPVAQSLNAKLDAGEIPGPDYFFAGPHVALRGGHPAAMMEVLLPWPLYRLIAPRLSFMVEDRDDIDRALDALAEAGADLVKITLDDIPVGAPKLSLELARYTVERAHARGWKVAAHVGRNADVELALAAGVDILAHGVYREPISAATVSRIRAAGVPMSPTNHVFDSVDRLAHGDLRPYSRTMIALTEPDVLQALRNPPADFKTPVGMLSWLAAVHAARQERLDNVAVLRDAGVTILAGSDSSTMGNQAGAALLAELELLVEGGLTPAQALIAATRNNAAAYGLSDRGVVAEGLRADLLLVEGDPTADIAALEEVRGLWRGGRRVERLVGYRAE